MPSVVDPLEAAIPHEHASNGCFETLRAYGGRLFRLNAHLDRLWASATFLGTPITKDRRQLARRLIEVLKRSQLQDAVVRIALVPPLGIASQRGQPSRAHIVVQPARIPPASAYRLGIRVAIVPARTFSVGAITPQAKYSARLGSVLAVIDAQLRRADEALFMDALGYVTESTASNFGIVSRGVILTPPCWLGLLAGITRDVLFELAEALRLAIREVPLTRHDLYNADEAFLLSTLREVMPVTVVDGRRIGTGRPGSITKKLHLAFRQLVKRELGW